MNISHPHRDVFLDCLRRLEGIKAPLTAEGAPTTEAIFECVVERHDNHNVECKIEMELPEKSEKFSSEVFLFVPKNFGMREQGKLIFEDFRSRMRISLPPTDRKAGYLAFQTAFANLGEVLSQLDQQKDAKEKLLRALRSLASVITVTFDQAFQRLQSNFRSEFENKFYEIQKMLRELRDLYDADPAFQSAFFRSFDEYISSNYIFFLDRLSKLKSLHPEILKQLDDVLKTEAKYRMKFGPPLSSITDESEREKRLLRMNQMKKFFQLESFVEVTKKPVMKKLSETTTMLGTGIAAVLAAFVTQWGDSIVKKYTAGGVFMISAGVMIYVFRDRLKEVFRDQFQNQLAKRMPDYEMDLILKNQKISEVKEWLSVVDHKSLPEIVKTARSKRNTWDFESEIGEDVAIAKKEFTTRDLPENAHSLVEVLRINVESFLKLMDDSHKDFLDISADGQKENLSLHRVYYFYLAVRLRSLKSNAEVFQWNRLTLDKSGLLRIEVC